MIELGLGQIHAMTSIEIDKGDIPKMAARLQDILGSRLQVLQPIAIGGMATIFQVRHRLHHGLFVAKVLHPGLTCRPAMIRAFYAEASHAARLGGHPNAIPIFDFGEVDGLFFMTMPYVEGEDLDKLLQRTGSCSEDETIAFAVQISELLRFAESNGIVHCDLTPANIRLDVFGTYRVLDFGISRSGTFKGDRTFRGGTPLYMSPEQLRGETADHRSDLYSLGTIMAEMLSGQPLFYAETLPEIDQRHLDGDWQMPHNLNKQEGVGHLLVRLLATKREDRLQSASELSNVLASLDFREPEIHGRSGSSCTLQKTFPLKRRARLSID